MVPHCSTFQWTTRLLISTYGYGALFGLLMLGIVGLPLPDEALLTFAGYLCFKGDFKAGTAVLTAAITIGSRSKRCCGATSCAGISKRARTPASESFGGSGADWCQAGHPPRSMHRSSPGMRNGLKPTSALVSPITCFLLGPSGQRAQVVSMLVLVPLRDLATLVSSSLARPVMSPLGCVLHRGNPSPLATPVLYSGSAL